MMHGPLTRLITLAAAVVIGAGLAGFNAQPASASGVVCHTVSKNDGIFQGGIRIAVTTTNMSSCYDGKNLRSFSATASEARTGLGITGQWNVHYGPPKLDYKAYDAFQRTDVAEWTTSGTAQECIGVGFVELCSFTEVFHMTSYINGRGQTSWFAMVCTSKSNTCGRIT